MQKHTEEGGRSPPITDPEKDAAKVQLNAFSEGEVNTVSAEYFRGLLF